MLSFLQQHADRVIGFLKGWDRMRLRGTLRCLAHGKGVASYLLRSGRQLADFGRYATWSSERIRRSADETASAAKRPLIYLANPGVSKEEVARQVVQKDGIEQGLICILTAVEPCWSFRLVQNKAGEGLGIQSAYRKCQHVYYYHLHPVFGLMHLRVQTWMPFNLHLCLNGREWLSRQMDAAGLKYVRKENCFTWVADVAAAQQLLEEQVRFDWEPALAGIVQEMHPTIDTVVRPYDANYYWSIEESEWASDVMFRSEAELSLLYESLIRHGMATFGSRDVMRFLGQRVPAIGNAHPRDYREIMTDLKTRPEGIRIKHRLGKNTVKMYNKQGTVLRVETTLNNVRKLKTPRNEDGQVIWKQMRKGVVDARRRAEVSDQANERYLQALAAVGTPAPLKTLTQGLAAAVLWKGARVRGLNLFAEDDTKLLEIVGQGEFMLQGIRNRDLQAAWFGQASTDPIEKRRRSGQMTRRLRLLRAHGLIHKVPRTHRYLVSDKGRQVIAAMVAARNADIAQLTKAA
jgi:hypothetical protein